MSNQISEVSTSHTYKGWRRRVGAVMATGLVASGLALLSNSSAQAEYCIFREDARELCGHMIENHDNVPRNYTGTGYYESNGESVPTGIRWTPAAGGASVNSTFRIQNGELRQGSVNEAGGISEIANLGKPAGVSFNSSLSPAVTSWGAGRLDVFAVSTNKSIWHRWWVAGPTGWSGWENLGGVVNSSPAAVSWGPNRIDLFVRADANNALLQLFWNGSTWAWYSHGGVLTAAPAVASRGSGMLDVYVRGTGNQLYSKHYPSSWGGFSAVSDAPVMLSGPAATAYNGKTYLYYQTTDHLYSSHQRIYARTLSATGTTAKTVLTGVMIFDPTLSSKVILDSNRQMTVAIAPTDKDPGYAVQSVLAPTLYVYAQYDINPYDEVDTLMWRHLATRIW